MKIHQGDCMEVFKTLKRESFDAVITDPPYGVSISGAHKFGNKAGHTYGAEEAVGWDREIPTGWIIEAARVLKPGGAFLSFTDTKRPGLLWDECKRAGLRPLRLFFWAKTNPPPNPRKNFQSAVEVAVFARKPGKIIHWDGGGATRNIYQTPISMGSERTAHPTQKNLDLMRFLVRLLCPKGGRVLDPFGGSGTTAVAAMLEKRVGVMIERDPEYVTIATQRLAEWERSDQNRQLDLLGQEGST